MKKFLAMILTLAIVLSMSTMVFAETTIDDDDFTDNKATDSGDVNVNVTGVQDTIVYNVTIQWDALSFTYNFANSVWDPETHTYKPADANAADWDNNEANIVVTNHSNAVVYASAKFADGQEKEKNGVTATVANTVLTLPNAATESYGDRNSAPASNIEVSISGTPTTKDNFEIEGIIVTISSTAPAQGE